MLRYGLEGQLPLTLKEIGRRLGVTREWVRKIELRAVRKLDDGDDDELRAGSRQTTARHRSAPATAVASPASTGATVRARVRPRLLPRAIRRTERSSQTAASAL